MSTPKGILIYPEFPNTFFLTYRILSNTSKEYGGAKWEEKHCEWNDTEHMLEKILKKSGNDFDFICYYGTEDLYFNNDPLVSGFNCSSIPLPKYHPRFLFIPYDFSIYDVAYKNNPKIDVNGIITKNDITGFPKWNNTEITKYLKERGIQSPFFSDTRPQAEEIEKRLRNLLGLANNSKQSNRHPFRVYYYGAPLTVFYLKHYPEFLPIRISESDFIQDDHYKRCFNTYLHIYHKDSAIINNLILKIQSTIFSSYVDAINEPLLLTPMYRLFRENVPRGQFYTMRNVQDFARAITLHCDPNIDAISQEIWGHSDAAKEAEIIKENHIKLLHHFKELTSDSIRNEDKDRVESFNKIKKIALGCRLYLLASLYQDFESDYFSVASHSNLFSINKEFSRRFSALYNTVISCLTWEFVLSLKSIDVPDVSHAVLSDDDQDKKKKKKKKNPRFSNRHTNDENLFLRYKEDEEQVTQQFTQFKVEKDGLAYSDEEKDLEKLIAYTEDIIKKYVSESIRDKSLEDQKKVYNSFSSFAKKNKQRNDKILFAFLRRIVSLKVYDFSKSYVNDSKKA